ncbi:glycosyltransferase family 39 protein [Nocardioides sp.]|uniref:ArnT family glycosyltransferase n=1 Tax=Nocardioides sp. TaxID=35761 RepID=UPI001A17F67B|nr:glycosyltransferase family 39 protein [Nocardioides sp.]MBJ7357225.1 glycosyltransferase family 39 protein [Nocardioides sp.]
MSTLVPTRPTTPEALPSTDAPLPRRRRSRDARLVLVLVAVTGLVHGLNIAGWPAYFDDEGTYLSQAFAVYGGDLAPYTYWYDHPPAGWILLAPLAWLPAQVVETQLVAGRLVMLLCSMVSAALLYVLARRLHLRRGFAAAAVLLWALSPLTVLESRQVFLDGLAVPWLLGAFALALAPRRGLGHAIGAGILLGVACLTKETTLVFAPAVVWALWLGSDRRTRAFDLVGFTLALGVTGGQYLLYALLKGELFSGAGHVSLVDALRFQLEEREGSGFILEPGSGAHGILQYWLSFDSLLVIGGLVAGVAVLLRPRTRPLGVAVLIAAAVALRPDGYLPFMYVTVALPFCALALAAALDHAWSGYEHLRGDVGPGQPRERPYQAMAFVTTLLVAGPVLLGWPAQLRTALTEDVNQSHPRAVEWITDNLSTDDVVVTDNTYFLDLAEAGWDPGWGVVWFTKLDLDPAADRELPDGWRDVDYVVWSEAFAFATADALPEVSQLQQNSIVVASFGEGAQRVEIRQVTP